MVDPTDRRIQPTGQPSRHPLVPMDRRVRILHRPRFTSSEILLLNALINRAPDPVSVRELRQLLAPFSAAYPTVQSIKQHVAHLRAKLGEPRRFPVQILSVKERRPNEWGVNWLQVVGYRWNDEAEA